MSRNTNDLHPYVKKLAEELVIRAMNNGIPVIITQTLRTIKEQDELYAQGRTKQGRIVTKARGGESMHNYGLAFDVALVKNGRAVWDEDADLNKNQLADWEEVGRLGEELGLEWGGRWRFPDRPHFQYTFGLTIKDLKAGKRPPYS